MATSSTTPARLLSIQNLTVNFRGAALPAVDALSLSIAAGESLGLVGESGSGKSVTALSILRLLPEASTTIRGSILYTPPDSGPQDLLTLSSEAVRSLRGRDIAMIFQEPMTALNPVMPVGAQIAESYVAHHRSLRFSLSRHEIRETVHAAMETVALPDPVRRARDYPHQFSGGERQRILIAMAIINRPRLLIADEPTTALDVTVQAQILRLLARLREEHGLSMLFISHDLAVVSQVTERIVVMRHGIVVESAPVKALFRGPRHPYTRALLRAIPTLEMPLNAPLATLAADAERRYSVLEEQSPDHWVRSS